MIGFLRKHFVTGLLSLTPLALTAWILKLVWERIDATLRPLLQRVPTLSETYPEFVLNLVGLVVIVLLITLIGMFTRNLIGIAAFRLLERVVERIPVVKSVYSGTKQIATVFLQDRRTAFEQVVVFAYPRQGMYAMGFVTRDEVGEDLVNVFLPTTPNPTSGFMLLVPRGDLRTVDMPVEEAIKLIVSGGAIMTPEQAAQIGGGGVLPAPAEAGKDVPS